MPKMRTSIYKLSGTETRDTESVDAREKELYDRLAELKITANSESTTKTVSA
jgi:hypothetical protein